MLGTMHRRERAALVGGFALAALAATGVLTSPAPPETIGAAQVIDGDSLDMAGVECDCTGSMLPNSGSSACAPAIRGGAVAPRRGPLPPSLADAKSVAGRARRVATAGRSPSASLATW